MPALKTTLGMLPSGLGVPLTDDQFTKFINEKYITNPAEINRQKTADVRLSLYKDDATWLFEKDVDALFKNARVRQMRKDMIPYSEYQNLTRRITNEYSAVYSEPARRTVASGQEQYQLFQRDIRMDRRMRLLNRMVNLCNDCLAQYRTQNGKPYLDVITPNNFWAISHPNDPTLFVGAIIKQFPMGTATSSLEPHYLVVSDTEVMRLDKSARIIHSLTMPVTIGQIPLVLVNKDERDSSLLDATSGTDLTSAHRALVLLNVMMLKHQKSGTRIPYATGDTGNVARDQPMDEETIIEMGEGVQLNTLEMGADPANYIAAARNIIKQIASNYSIPESVFDLSYQATSGFEIKLKRSALAEVRRDQIVDYRDHEHNIVVLESKIAHFSIEGWAIDFGETDPPEEPLSKLAYYDKYIEMGLANIYEVYMQDNPEATEEEAVKHVDLNIALRIEQMQKFQAANPTVFTPVGGSNPPATQDGGTVQPGGAGIDPVEIARSVLGGS